MVHDEGRTGDVGPPGPEHEVVMHRTLPATVATLVAVALTTAPTPAHADVDPVVVTPVQSGNFAGEDPLGVDVDAQGRRWIVGNTAVRRFPAGSTTPDRVIVGASTGFSYPTRVSVDADGRVYVAEDTSNSIRVFAPDANGNVAPERVIAGANTGISYPSGLDVDAAGYIHVADSTTNMIATFAPSASGNAHPIHRISGPRTQLTSVNGVVRRGNLLWAGSPEADAVVAFPFGSSGDVGPTTVVGGTRSRLVNPAGIAFDGGGNLYVVNGDDVRHLVVFGPGSDGNATPARVVTVASRNQEPNGVAVDARRRVTLINIANSRTDVLPAVMTTAPSAPRALKVSGGSSAKTRTIRWSVPAADGFTPVTGYEVRVMAGSKVVRSATRTAGQRSLAVSRSSLGKGKRVAMVRARNATGRGPWARVTFTVR
jgi:sugar lactone lactonase YvrE